MGSPFLVSTVPAWSNESVSTPARTETRPVALATPTAVPVESASCQLAESGVRAAHSAASDREVKARVAARIYGIEAAARLFADVSLRDERSR